MGRGRGNSYGIDGDGVSGKGQGGLLAVGTCNKDATVDTISDSRASGTVKSVLLGRQLNVPWVWWLFSNILLLCVEIASAAARMIAE